MKTRYVVAAVCGVVVTLVGVVSMVVPVMSFWPVPVALVGASIMGVAFNKIEENRKKSR